MIYIIGITKNAHKADQIIRNYTIYDTLSESVMILAPSKLAHLILNCKMRVVNAKIQNNYIIVTDWVNRLRGGCPYTLLTVSETICKIASFNGFAARISIEELEHFIIRKEIANCNIVDKRIIWIDTYQTIKDTEFEKQIAIKYKEFMSKAHILGYGNVSFNYEIENQQVKLKKYTGTSKNVILPSFITAIMVNAFNGIILKTLNLNEGLRVIGTMAFAPTHMSEGLETIEIPSTVELIEHGAFSNNSKLIKINGALNLNKIKLRSDKTIILDEFN